MKPEHDMMAAIMAKSDQLNADDLVGGPITVCVTGVAVKSDEDQPITINYENDNGKPFKPCKNMGRVLVNAWGRDSSQYVGRHMTLFRDVTVEYGKDQVGGIRICDLSHIDGPQKLMLTLRRGRRAVHTVQPIKGDLTLAKAAEPVSIAISPQLLTKGAESALQGGSVYRLWFEALEPAQRKALVDSGDHERLKAESIA